MDEALSWFAGTRWKDAARRAAKAEVAFSYVLAERSPELAIPAFERLTAAGTAFEGSKGQEACAALRARAAPPIAAKPPSKPGPDELQRELARSWPERGSRPESQPYTNIVETSTDDRIPPTTTIPLSVT